MSADQIQGQPGEIMPFIPIICQCGWLDQQRLDQQKPVDLTQRRYEAVFLGRGIAAAAAKAQAQFWARLKSSDPTVISPADDPIADYQARKGRNVPWIETDPVSGVSNYRTPIPGLYAAASSRPISGGLPVTLEMPPSRYVANAREPIDRYALNPAVSYFQAQFAGLADPDRGRLPVRFGL
jgi:hypothetical protein